jgi:DNA invertase Pin-like site-specific DNA recombinase/DNA-binding XRE family transcriptional regulator
MLSPAREKIKGQHLERLALIYLRQSSPGQVRKNFRSTERQYGLSEEAVKLGWQAEQVVAIDGDLGVSGRFSDGQARGAFKELLARVCLGEVGAIFGLEVSRLARSSAETQRLLEYCGLTDTLVIDTDGVYDLRDFNDQLVLGVKSQLSQAELHVMAVRLQGARRHAAERGELRFPLAVGYLYDQDGRWIIDPDQEVQAALYDLFRAFGQTGSAYGVVGVFKDRRFPQRTYGGVWTGELRWGPLTYQRIVRILQNPCYVGAYVFGRHRSQRVVEPDGTIRTKVVQVRRSEWAVVIQDHHPGYISWQEHLDNVKRLTANYTRSGQRPVREGNAICQGIVRCGGCGRSMSTLYSAKDAHYECQRSRLDQSRTPGCRGVKAQIVDGLVVCRLLDALQPEQIALALKAADELQDRRARSDRALQLRVERARYEAALAERAFRQCDPDNRLVAQSLEDRWEEKLKELRDAEAELTQHAAAQTVEPSREQIEALARDLPALWAAKTTADRDRKRLLRALIADVTIISKPDTRELRVGIHWRSGATEQHTIQRPQSVIDQRRTPPEALDLIKRLGPHRTNAELAAELQTAGLRTGTGLPFTAHRVRSLRNHYRIRTPPLLRGEELTVKQLAERLGVSIHVIYSWISSGKLAARRGHTNQLCIPFPPKVERQCRERIINSTRLHPRNQNATEGGAV